MKYIYLILIVSKNVYYYWIKNKDIVIINSSEMKLQARISVIFEQIRQIYGSFRIQKIFEREDLF